MAVSSQFVQYYITDYGGTPVDVSGYVLDVNPTRDPDSIDVTTFRTGGAGVTQAKVRGALKSEFTITMLLCPFTNDLMIPLNGNNSGSLHDIRMGRGAAPTTNDDKFSGTFTVCKIHEDYSATATGPATIKVDVKPTDGGATAPAWSKI